MTRRMLVDAAHAEEIRVVVVNDEKIEDFEVETSGKEQVKGNIYVAEVTRVEPSLQAAFVDYGGNRNGFLAFSEIHPEWFSLPEEERQALLAELEEIADNRRKRTEEMEDQREQELEAKETSKQAAAEKNAASDASDDKTETEEKTHQDEEKTKSEEKPKRTRRTRRASSAAKENVEDTSETSNKESKSESKNVDEAETSKEAAETVETSDKPKKPARKAKVSKKDSSKEDKDSKTESDDENLTEEEKAEDARAMAIASSMAETLLDDDDKEKKKRAKRPRRHAKGKKEEEAKASNSDEDDNDSDTPPLKSAHDADLDDKDIDLAKDEIEDSTSSKERRQPIHRRYNIEDVIKEGQKILIQVNKEERGNKGAAVSTYISLPGRFVVLMPNTPYAGGISRKITDLSARRQLKKAIAGINIPLSMGMIVRTAGVGQDAENIQRDVSNLLNHWEKIEKAHKECTSRNKLVHEDGALIIRAARDMLSEDCEEINISGRRAYRSVKDYVKAIMPEMAKIVKEHRASTPIFTHYGVETELTQLHRVRVELPSGGYLIINPTEALVSIDVNSGRATQEKNIEETAYKTNMEAAEEVCRQLRLRDLAGLVVIDFIDMEDRKNERNIEKIMRKAIKKDRARIQLAPISQFGLLEMSRQRLRPSLGENTSISCPHCNGAGFIPSLASAALMLLRGVEEEIAHTNAVKAIISTSSELSIYVLNHKRDLIRDMEARYKFQISFVGDDRYIAPDHKLELIHVDSSGTEKKTSQEIKMRQPSEEQEASKNRRRRRGGRNRKSSDTDNKNTTTQKTESAQTKGRDKEESAEDKKSARGDRSRRSRRTRRDRGDRTERNDRSNTVSETGKSTAETKNVSDQETSSQTSANVENASPEKEERKGRRDSRRRRPARAPKEAGAEKVESTDASAASSSDASTTAEGKTEATEKKGNSRYKSRSKKEHQTSDRAAKGITVETVDGSGTKTVEETNGEKSAVGKAFQRWWGKGSE